MTILKTDSTTSVLPNYCYEDVIFALHDSSDYRRGEKYIFDGVLQIFLLPVNRDKEAYRGSQMSHSNSPRLFSRA